MRASFNNRNVLCGFVIFALLNLSFVSLVGCALSRKICPAQIETTMFKFVQRAIFAVLFFGAALSSGQTPGSDIWIPTTRSPRSRNFGAHSKARYSA